MSVMSGVFSYFGSKWSFSQFRVKDNNCKCALFDNKIFAISTEGNYFMGQLKKEGEVAIEKQVDLLEESNQAYME